jgi:hexosaminidase
MWARSLAVLGLAASALGARSYLYFPNSDVESVTETIFPSHPGLTVAELSNLCDQTPSCIGFNTDGWLKNASSSLGPTPVDLYMIAPTPAPAPPPLLWPMPKIVSIGASKLVLDAANFQFSATTPCMELDAAFTRFTGILFPRGAFPTAEPARRAGAAVLARVVVAVDNVSVPLDLGVDESYSLSVPADGSPASISAPTVWGALHGLQTLSQLVAFDFDAQAYWTDAPVAVSDAPQFAWRGVMVDPARQFLQPNVLRSLIDSLTTAKLNTIHVHLLDCDSFPIQVAQPFDQLWKGAFSPRERYTAREMAALVEYARIRGVRIVYEFDQPGHMGAMCKGYPELCPTPACSSSYGGDVLDPSSASTIPAMNAVVDALVAASIDSVLHLGGDEVGDACWLASPAVQAWMKTHNISDGNGIYEYFVMQSNDMAIARGKSPMRWEEVWKHFGTALDRSTIVHAWLSSAALIDAADNGYRTVYSVNDNAHVTLTPPSHPPAVPRL